MYVARAAQAIESGQASTIVISFASNQRSARSRSLGGVVESHTPEAQFEAPYGPLFPASYYAMAAQKYLHEYGGGRERLAEVAVLAREWALLNPKAFRFGSGRLTVEEVMAADMISSPLSVADCCLVTDGGGAVVLTSLDRARDLAQPPIRVLGYGESTTNTSMSQVELLPTGAVESGRAAFRRAELTVADVDVIQLYDSFTITVILSLEALGFCEPGSAPSLIASDRVRLGGDLPLNTSGGGLSYCHPGQFGVLLLVEAVRQLRGEAGQRQIFNPKVALAHGTGGILSTHATVILGVDQ
jgi:acetyl-CoA acetyltransferase